MSKSTRVIVAENVRHIRKTRKFSQEQLGDRANVHRTYISMLERSETSVSLDLLTDIANALKVPVDALLRKDFYKTLE